MWTRHIPVTTRTKTDHFIIRIKAQQNIMVNDERNHVSYRTIGTRGFGNIVQRTILECRRNRVFKCKQTNLLWNDVPVSQGKLRTYFDSKVSSKWRNQIEYKILFMQSRSYCNNVYLKKTIFWRNNFCCQYNDIH